MLNFNKIFIAFCMASLMFSCTTEEEVIPKTNEQDLSIPLPLLEPGTTDTKGSIENTRQASPSDANEIWRYNYDSRSSAQSDFYREGGSVFESIKGGDVLFQFNIFYRGSNFVYLSDNSRPGFQVALPTWNTGDLAHAYFRTDNGGWVQWRLLVYTNCDNDQAAPYVGPRTDATSAINSYNKLINGDYYYFNYNRFPISFNDTWRFMQNAFSFVDGCDETFTITQSPAIGTVFKSPTTVNTTLRIQDQSGNVRVLQFKVHLRRI